MYENKTQLLMMIKEKITNLVSFNINNKRLNLNHLLTNHIMIDPSFLYKDHKTKLLHVIEKLELINPLGVLKRGYSLTYINDNLLTSITNVNKDDVLKIKLQDGNIITKVIEKE